MRDTVLLQAEMTKWALHRNLAGLSHEQSLVSPEPGGNSANWVVGHLITGYDNLLKAVGAEPVADGPEMDPYRRGCEPMDPASARPFEELLADFDTCHDRMAESVAGLGPDDLARPAPSSPRNDPNETIGSLIGLVAFHQAYHTGQTGILRRVVGESGAIA